jgi:hypothetical protein
MIRRLAVAASLVAGGASGVARADSGAPGADAPDPAVEYAADANLESTANRQDLTLAVSGGAGLLVGLGIEGPTGRGGSADVRLGHVATPRTVITFEAGLTIVLHGTMSSPTYTNANLDLLAGAQYYVSESLWLRFAGGVGVYQASHVQAKDNNVSIDVHQVGPAVLGAIGLDVARFKWAVFNVEIGTSVMVHSGALVASDLRLGVQFD